MKRLTRALPALLSLILPATFLVCSAGSPSNPFASSAPRTTSPNPVAPTNLPSVTTTASRFDVDANGADSVTITATALSPAGQPLAGAQVLWTLSSRNFSGAAGSISTPISFANSVGQATVTYTSPNLEFVPVGAIAVITATVSVPNNPEGSPRSSVTLVIRPKGVAPTGGTTGPAGEPVAPIITSVTPTTLRIDSPGSVVIVQGTGFSETSEALLIAPNGLFNIDAEVLSSTQIRFGIPSGLSEGQGTLFITGPGNQLSLGFVLLLTTAGGTGTSAPSISAISPSSGPVESANPVVLLGANFALGNCPSEGFIAFVGAIGIEKVCPNLATSTSTRIEFTTPRAGAIESGATDVTVTNADGQTSNSVTYTFTSEGLNPPNITSITPNSGPTLGGTRISIKGNNFQADDVVVFASASIPGGQVTICAAGAPTCDNGTPKTPSCASHAGAAADFVFVGPGEIQVSTQCVGTAGAGLTDVFVRNSDRQVSNADAFTYVATPQVAAPVITQINPTGLIQACGGSCSFCPSGCNVPPGTLCQTGGTQCQVCSGDCIFEGYDILILGRNFDRCASIVMVHNGVIHEFLPDLRGSDHLAGTGDECAFRDVNIPSTCSTARPDIVPYPHNLIVHSGSCVAPNPLPGTPGAYVWVNEGEIRLIFGPRESLACNGSDAAQIYISNDPGTGLTGDEISNNVGYSFSCQSL